MSLKNDSLPEICILAYSSGMGEAEGLKKIAEKYEVRTLNGQLSQSAFAGQLNRTEAPLILLVDTDRFPLSMCESLINTYLKNFHHQEIGYYSKEEPGLWGKLIYRKFGAVTASILDSPFFIGPKKYFAKAYAGEELGHFCAAVGYSLQRISGIHFRRVDCTAHVASPADRPSVSKYRLRYSWQIPARYLFSGEFFRNFLNDAGKVQRDMVWRMLFVLLAGFTFLCMPSLSSDYGVTGDEFVDHRHAGYVLDYFAGKDSAALHQPKTFLHLYGNSVQVIAAAVCRWFGLDNCYEVRHLISSFIGATGILFAGLAGLRWGGGLCGLLTLLLMFFTPRFFGHSMNNLKDIPFAVGYIIALYYTVRLFDHYPRYRIRHIAGVVSGIALALGTRSGGLILYPMLFMYAGLFYIQYYGIREFYKFRKYLNPVLNIFSVLLLIIGCSYMLAIILWPFALQRPIGNVLYSLEKFTYFSIGLRTIFDGEQMMSNMLPWKYAPEYLCIGMPVVTVIGFFGYAVYMCFRKKEFSLLAYFFLFATIFPVFWVVYKNSNLYGGIRHLLFVMPPMVVIAGRFWSQIIENSRKYLKTALAVAFIGLLSLPVIHTLKNHPNQYVYFNEIIGGLKGGYGNFETDYYFNSLKESATWFRQNVLPDLPKDRKTIVVSQFSDGVKYYLRKDTNVQVIYSRYYEKYAKDWDYAILGNVYVDRFQLQHGGFPPSGSLFAAEVDHYPMSCVVKRRTKDDLKGFQLEKEQKYEEALSAFEQYVASYPENPEVWGRMSKLYYSVGRMEQGKAAAEKALQYHPKLNEALYMLVLIDLKLRDYTGAFEAVNKMLSVNSVSVDAYYLRASVYYAMKRYQEAIKDLNKVLAMRPKYDRALVLAGDIFRDNGDYQQALKMYQAAINSRNTISTQVQSADMLVRMNNYPEAVKRLQKLIEVQAAYYPIYKVESRMYLQQGDLKRAGACLKRLDNIVEDAELFVLRAMYYQQINDKEAMAKMLEYALALEPGQVEALKLKKGI